MAAYEGIEEARGNAIKEAQEKAEQARQAAQAAAEVANLAAQEARLLQQAADSQARHAQYELKRQADWARVLPTLTQLNATVREATTGEAVNVTVPVLDKVVEWNVSWRIEPTTKLEKRTYSDSVHVEFTVATKAIQVRTTIDGDKPANYRVLRGGGYNWTGISKAISERCQRVCVRTTQSNQQQYEEAVFLANTEAKLLANGCTDVTKLTSWTEHPRNRYQSGTHHTASVSGKLANNVRITVTPGAVELRVICKDEERGYTIDAFVKHALVAH